MTHGDLSILSIFVLCSPPFEAFSDPGVVEANGVLVPDAVLSLPAPDTCPVELAFVLGAMLIPFNIPSKFAVWFSCRGAGDPVGAVAANVGADVSPANRSDSDTA